MHSELSVTPKQRVLTGQQRTFCEGVVKGLTLTKAYLRAYPASALKSAEANSSRLIRTDRIKKEISRLRRRTEEHAVLSLAEKRAFLARVVRCDLANIDLEADGDLLKSMVPNKFGTKLELHDKLMAIAKDNELAGDTLPKTLRLELIASTPDAAPPLDALDIESVVSREGEPQRGDS